MKRTIHILVNSVGLAAAVLVVVAVGLHYEDQKMAVPRSHPVAHLQPVSYLGVYEPSSPHSYSSVAEFGKLVAHRPQIAVYYSSWFEPFQSSFARAAHAHLATPMVQIEPADTNIAAIAAGKYDSYLIDYARAVRSFRYPVIISFGHEMNADWYGWGYRHIRPATFVAAWRHIHTLFHAERAYNVTWLWTVNVVGSPRTSPVRPWWPGASYVNWVGIDGHYFQQSLKFPNLFGATLAQVRKLGHLPMFIAEAGIGEHVGIGKITDLFAGAQAHGIIGVMWFDVKGHNLRIEGDPAAISIFRRAVKRYVTPAGNELPGKTPGDAIVANRQGGAS
jgi:mannan endo-1,4-beta-mannosidase